MKFDPLSLEGIETAGALRERLWSELVRQNIAAYPMPPHGHNPNFKGAAAAAKHLMLHPSMASAKIVLVGMEAALQPVRALVLERGKVLLTPHRTKSGAYWRLEGAPKQAAKLPNLPLYGTETTSLEGVQVAVIASTVVDKTGSRLSKGFGFGAQGSPVGVPVLTVAHPIMVLERLPFTADSRVVGFATPEKAFVF